MEVRTSNKCPATILAAKRTPSVKGRIKFLMSSINTIKGTNTVGVPLGTKWAKNNLGVLKIEGRTKETHTKLLIVRVMHICLVEVNTYGNKPKKLLISANRKIEEKIRGTLLPSLELPIVKSSFLIPESALLIKMPPRDKTV